MTEAEALYLPDHGGFIATVCTQGAWDPNAQNGAAVLTLFGHVVEDIPTLVPMALSRMNVDLVRPVPIGRRFVVDSTILREGKKIQLVELTVTADGTEYARARVLRLRTEDISERPALPPSTEAPNPVHQLQRPDEVRPFAREGGPGFLRGIEMRRARRGDGDAFGYWVRLLVPVVAGEPVRVTSRQTMAVDFANCIGVPLELSMASTINPDVTAHLLRPPVGEWIAIVGDTWFGHDTGRGISLATLSDDEGVFGVASTSQLVQPR